MSLNTNERFNNTTDYGPDSSDESWSDSSHYIDEEEHQHLHEIPPGKRVFTDLLLKRTAEVCDVVREMHQNRNPDNIQLLAELAQLTEIEPPVRLMELLCKSGLPSVLVDIVADKDSYVSHQQRFSMDEELSDCEGFHYTTDAYRSLLQMVGYMSFSLKEDENDYMESASDCLVRLQKLWKLVLEHFIPLGLLEEDRDDSTYGPLWSFVTAIIGYGTDLYDATKKWPGLKDPLGMVMLYLWQSCSSPPMRQTIIQVLQRFLFSSSPSFSAFVEAAIAHGYDLEAIVDGYLDELLNREIMAAGLFSYLFVLDLVFIRYCLDHQQLRYIAENRVGRILHAHIVVGQRMICGDDPPAHVRKLIIGTAYSIFSPLLTVLEGNPRITPQILQNVDIIHIMAHDLVYAVSIGDESFSDPVVGAIDRLGWFGHDLSPDQSQRMRVLVRRHSVMVTDGLAKLILSQRTLALNAIEAWENLRRRLHVQLLTDDPPFMTSWSLGHKACHSAECVCHAMKPSHELKVCKGCWSVLYCSRRCQKIDWVKGHRSVCRSRTPSN